MPEVMLRRNERGQLLCYVAKRDLEAVVKQVEFDEETRWGGTLELDGGERFYLEPLAARPALPLTVRTRKL